MRPKNNLESKNAENKTDSQESELDKLAPEERKWREDLGIKSNLDVCDSYDHWCAATVEKATPSHVFVHYDYWTSKWDEWISRASPRLARKDSRVYIEGGKLRKGQQLEVYDEHPAMRRHLQGYIIEERLDSVLVHFKNYHSKFDEWISRDSDRFAPWGTYTCKPIPYKPNQEDYWYSRARVRNIVNTDPRWSRYAKALEEKNLSVVEMEGDGNCLFRAVSHQVYGTQDHHLMLRAKTADYMEVEGDWFQNFVVGSASQYAAYLQRMRQPKVWGDDPQVQAMCEMYNRPAEIWVYDAVQGATKIKTFHHQSKATPIRLSYYGGGHYDSITGPKWRDSMIQAPPGMKEEEAISLRRLHRQSGMVGRAYQSSDLQATEEEAFRAAMDASRNEFEYENENIDAALQASLEHGGAAGVGAPNEPLTPGQVTTQAPVRRRLEEDIVNKVMSDSDVAETQEALLKAAQEKKWEEDTRAAQEASLAALGGQDADIDPMVLAALGNEAEIQQCKFMPWKAGPMAFAV